MSLHKWLSNFPKDTPLYYKDGVFYVNAGFVSSRYFADSDMTESSESEAFAYSMSTVREALHDMPVSYRVGVDDSGVLHVSGLDDSITLEVAPLASKVPSEALDTPADFEDAVELPWTDALSELTTLARSSLSFAQRNGYGEGYLHVSCDKAWLSAGELTILFNSSEGYLPEDSEDILLSLGALKHLQRSKLDAQQGVYLTSSHLMYVDGNNAFNYLYVKDGTNVTLPAETLRYLDVTEGIILPESVVSLLQLKSKLTSITSTGVHCGERFFTVETGIEDTIYLPDGIAQILHAALKGNTVFYKDNRVGELMFTETPYNKIVGVF